MLDRVIDRLNDLAATFSAVGQLALSYSGRIAFAFTMLGTAYILIRAWPLGGSAVVITAALIYLTETSITP